MAQRMITAAALLEQPQRATRLKCRGTSPVGVAQRRVGSACALSLSSAKHTKNHTSLRRASRESYFCYLKRPIKRPNQQASEGLATVRLSESLCSQGFNSPGSRCSVLSLPRLGAGSSRRWAGRLWLQSKAWGRPSKPNKTGSTPCPTPHVKSLMLT